MAQSTKIDAKVTHGAPDGWFKPGAGKSQWFKDSDIGPEMVVVPAGSFTMGSNFYAIDKAPPGWVTARSPWLSRFDESEKPPHKVTIMEPFAVGRFAVTFDEWDAAGLAHTCDDRGWGRGRRPAIQMSWDAAKAYTHWLSQTTGKSYRLPSEAEWEYCCRAGTTGVYSFGNSITRQQAQFSEDRAGSAKRTVEVGTFPPNAWGIYDMHGNVREWCEDDWHNDYAGAPQDGSAWRGGDSPLGVPLRVVRGGCWFEKPIRLRSASRSFEISLLPGLATGFRLVRSL